MRHRYDAAIEEVNQGRILTPIEPGGKRPLLQNWPQTVCNEYEVGKWFDADPRINIAVIAGRSKLQVIDADNEEAIEHCERNLSSPMVAESPSGRHYYFREDQDDPHSRIRIGGMNLDVLRGVRYVLLAPSFNAEKQRSYTWLKGPVPTAALPTLPELFPRKEVQPTTSLVSPNVEWATRILHEEYFSIEGCGGDLALFRAAVFLIQRARLDYQTAYRMLCEWNADGVHAIPPWPEGRIRYKISEAERLMR